MKKLILAASLLSSSSIMAADLTLQFTNLTHGSHFTPLIVSAHNSGNLFSVGHSATANLQAMAEGGDISGLVSDMNAISANVVADPAAGLMAPGQSISFDMTIDNSNTLLSVAAMVLPTNDGFVGLDALQIPKKKGSYTYYLNAYDAGTEANDEIVNGAGAPGAAGIPADPLGLNGTNATGVASVDSNVTVHIHRGVIGDTDSNGGSSDLDSRVHRWLNPVARLIIDVK